MKLIIFVKATNMELDYIGDELELFSAASNWKSYWSCTVQKYISGNVLEVGAGLGGNAPYLIENADSYTALEPDKALASLIDVPNAEVICGTTSDLVGRKFDTILYIDVLEHIKDDASEFARATSLLSDKGILVILCPAHQFLYTPFDNAIGHFKRYSKSDFKILSDVNESVYLEKAYYLDSIGIAASIANKYILRSKMPTQEQVHTWDKLLVPISRIVDKVLFNNIGKTVIGVWRKIDKTSHRSI